MPGRTWMQLAYQGNTTLKKLDGPNGYFLVADDLHNEVIVKKKDADFTEIVWVYSVQHDCLTRDLASFGGVATASPDHGVWNESAAGIYYACTNTSTNDLRLRTNVGSTSVNNGTTWEFQPVFPDDPFTLRQYQQLDLTFDVDLPTFVSITCTFNDNFSLSQTRSFASTTGPSVNNRLSFSVPRNAPAVANTIKINLFMQG